MESLAKAVVVIALVAAVIGALIGTFVAVATGAPIIACALVGAFLGPPTSILALKRFGKH